MEREDLVKKLMWNHGGTGFGICEFAGMLLQEEMKPSSPEEDWVSIVAVQGPAEKYSVEELEKIVAFSEERTKQYDQMFKWRKGCNLIFIGKERDGAWLRKRQTWRIGPMYSNTLDEAIEIMKK